MATDPNTLNYRSKPDAVGDDVRAMHRTFSTWALIWLVWAVGLGVWVVYLGVIAYVLVRFLS